MRNAVTDSAVSELMHEIERMRAEPVTEEELALAKNFMAGSFARSLEDLRTIAALRAEHPALWAFTRPLCDLSAAPGHGEREDRSP